MTKPFFSYCDQINSNYSTNLTDFEHGFNGIPLNQISLNNSFDIYNNDNYNNNYDFDYVNKIYGIQENKMNQMIPPLNQEINFKNKIFIDFKEDNFENNCQIDYEKTFNQNLDFMKDYYFKSIEEDKKLKATTEINKQIFEQNGNIISNSIIRSKKVISIITTKRKRNIGNKTKSVVFKTKNSNYAKNGNNINKNSGRISNTKKKIIRNFIQDNLIFWISDGKKEKKLKKLKSIKNYIYYKGKKLKEIYSENKDNQKIISEKEGNVMEKLNLNFEEVFKAFYSKDSENININDKIFYSKLKSKKEYINEKIKEKRDLVLFDESFAQILSDLEK